MDPENYKTIPALAAYIDRIGAEQLNFRRYMIREFRGNYYIENTLITIGTDCSITCSNPDYEPTEDEIADIMAQLAMVKFPKSVAATEAQFKQLKKKLKGSILYPFYTRKGDGGIVMVQSRMEKDGRKHYVPWSFWSDGKWRAMEPDGKLPFWKPKEKLSDRIMIHEGAKSAEAASKVTKDHPWYEDLKGYEHWGMIGGALAPHRADYKELEKEAPIEVVYVCDNDWPGFNALQKVSECWGKSLKGVRFSNEFPEGWDLADEMPQKMFTKKGFFTGPKLEDLTRPATRATTLVKVEGTKRRVAILTEDFKKEWRHTVSPEFYIHRDWPHKIWTADQFNSIVDPFSNVVDTTRLLKKLDGSKIASLEYNPGRSQGLYFGEDGRSEVINTFLPSSIGPKEGDASVWLSYLENLFPIDEDRKEVMRWVATLIARPDIRMPYSLLLISNMHGIGKTTLGEKILAPIIGMPNCSFPSERDISQSSFNSWLSRKRLIIVNEIYSGHSRKTYNLLKQIVSDKVVEVNEKFVKGYTIQNWAHVIASSNSFRALRVEEEDRRWLIPKCSEELRPHAYWKRLNDWLSDEGGFNIIVQWAHDYLKDNDPVKEGMHAPLTASKQEIIDDSLTVSQAIVKRIIDDLNSKHKTWWITDLDLLKLVQLDIISGPNKDQIKFVSRPLGVRKYAEKYGAHVGGRNQGCALLHIGPNKARVLSNNTKIAKKTPANLVKEGIMPIDISELEEI